MKPAKAPLSDAQRSEIWKSFWLHTLAAVGAGLLSVVIVVFGQANGLLIFPTIVLAGVPTFIVWSRFVGKIEKYKDSTGITYPLTYIVLAIISVIAFGVPLVLFISLFIRLSKVPRLGILNESSTTSPERHRITLPTPAPRPLPVPQKQPAVVQPIVHSSRIAREPQSTPPIMKPEHEETPEAPPVMDNEAFYEQVAEEIATDTMKPGVWARAFAETDGESERAKALYIRLRVAQLAGEREAELQEVQRLKAQQALKEKMAREEAAELKRQEQAAELQRLQEMEVARKEAAKQEADKLKREQREVEEMQAKQVAERKSQEYEEQWHRWAEAEKQVSLRREEARIARKERLNRTIKGSQSALKEGFKSGSKLFVITAVVIISIALFSVVYLVHYISQFTK